VEEIIVSNKVKLKLNSLVYIIFENEYFGFLESAEKYVLSIVDTILNPSLKTFKNTTP